MSLTCGSWQRITIWSRCVYINNMVLNYIHTYIYLIYDITILKLLLL